MLHILELDGCAPAPLAHYLKALGILRLIAEQANSQVRGWWEGDRFRLATTLDKRALRDFFLHRYRPTPLVSPWNKGAGFFRADDPGLAPLERSSAERFAPFRDGIRASREYLDALSEADAKVRAIKAETKDRLLSKAEREALKKSPEYKARLAEADRDFKRLKTDLLPNLRRGWRGPHREWLDAALVLLDDGEPKYPALLGTGGNDGRLDFTNNFMQRLGEVFVLDSENGGPRDEASVWIDGALWGGPERCHVGGKSVGQYLPGTVGGANNANGPDADSLVNPIDFIFMLEGSVLFTAHATKRLGLTATNRAAAPFVVSAHGAAYASASAADEGARGEQWMPLWDHPATLAEVQRLFSESRAQIGAKSAAEPLDMARAVARLGTARGVSRFTRFGYIERNGQSNLAVPLGQIRAPNAPDQRLACLDDLDRWLHRLQREARSEHAPARLRQAESQLANALFAVTQSPGETHYWQRVLLALTACERVMTSGSGFAAGPIPRLRPQWVEAANDGGASFRLAVALALQAAEFNREKPPIDPIRRHLLPLDAKQPGRFAASGGLGQARLEHKQEVVMHGASASADLRALVDRRLIDAAQTKGRYLPLRAARNTAVSIADLIQLLNGNVDLGRCLDLAQVLMALDHSDWAQHPVRLNRPRANAWPDDAWMALRLCFLPWPLRNEKGQVILDIPANPAIFRRLAAGDAAEAIAMALRRLRIAGTRCALRVASADPETARLWATALAFPIGQKTALCFLRRLDPTYSTQES